MHVKGVGGWMADEYIKRSELLELAREYYTNEQIEEAVPVKVIKNIPSADVAPVVHGEWIEYPECLKYVNAYADDHIVCSNCEECFSILDNCTERFDFCPHCGARMDGE